MIKFESLLLRNTHRLVAIAVQCGEKARGGRRSWTLPSCSPWIRRFEHKCPDQSVYTPCSQMDNAQIDRVFFILGLRHMCHWISSTHVVHGVVIIIIVLIITMITWIPWLPWLSDNHHNHDHSPDNYHYFSSVHLSLGKWSHLVPGFVD